MTQENKDLLIKDLCARLPYGVRCSFGVDDAVYEVCGINPSCCGASEIQATHIKSGINGDFKLTSCKPYLFPMSNMTDAQREEYESLCIKVTSECADISGFFYTKDDYYDTVESIDYLYKNHLDCKGLIPMGFALDATGLNIY
jgi:hypothetical protein